MYDSLHEALSTISIMDDAMLDASMCLALPKNSIPILWLKFMDVLSVHRCDIEGFIQLTKPSNWLKFRPVQAKELL